MSDPLIRAAKHRDVAALDEAIRWGADLSVPDSQGRTPLFHAADRGWTNGMKILIDAGADVNHGEESGFTALFSAVMSGRLEAVQTLLDAGARVRNVGGLRLSPQAQGRNRLRIIALLERAMQVGPILD
jgi:uncharacterized protein